MNKNFEQIQPLDQESPLMSIKARRVSTEEVEKNLGKKSIEEENNIDRSREQ